jgi:hypothetical protein
MHSFDYRKRRQLVDYLMMKESEITRRQRSLITTHSILLLRDYTRPTDRHPYKCAASVPRWQVATSLQRQLGVVVTNSDKTNPQYFSQPLQPTAFRGRTDRYMRLALLFTMLPLHCVCQSAAINAQRQSNYTGDSGVRRAAAALSLAYVCR